MKVGEVDELHVACAVSCLSREPRQQEGDPSPQIDDDGGAWVQLVLIAARAATTSSHW